MSASITRWAMIGTGQMADNIIEDFQLTENVELTTIVSRSEERGRAFAEKWGITNVVTELSALWELPDVDVVYVATPHPAHYEAAKAAIEAGKHVVVEKPMTMTAAEATDLGDRARRAGVFLMEAMWTCFNPAIRGMQAMIAAGEIGAPVSVQASFGYPMTYDPADRMWNPELGGGSTLDLGVYTISLACLVLGEPTSVTAVGHLSPDGVDVDATVVLGFRDGAQAVLTTSMSAFLPMYAAIGGTQGQIQVAAPFWVTERLTQIAMDLSSHDVEFPREGRGYVPMLRAVSAAILEGRTEHELHPVSRSVGVLTVIEEVIRQIRADGLSGPVRLASGAAHEA